MGNCDIQQLLKIGLIVKVFFLQSVYCIYICRWNLSMHLIKAGVADIKESGSEIGQVPAIFHFHTYCIVEIVY